MPVSKQYPELFHYTTLESLASILHVDSQRRSLWATHFGYLNDSTEVKSFFDKRLPELLKKCVGPTIVKKCAKDEKLLQFLITKYGSLDEYALRIESLLGKHLQTGIFTLIEPFIASFSASSNNYIRKNGLLSQWRGYGADGGCALVLSTARLEKLINAEAEKFEFVGLNLCKAQYYDHEKHKYDGAEMAVFETELKSIIESQIAEAKGQTLETRFSDAIVPLVEMAIRHKHLGFKEEREVRIIAVPRKPKFASKIANPKALVDYSFYLRKGGLIPHLKLFEGEELPIKRIIIGPHPDQNKRLEAVRGLLIQRGLDGNIKVVKSDIPYIGR